MAKTEQEMIERYKARMKRQNDAIKENYDRISATLPKGTIDRIKALGLTINGVANDAILSFLECAEECAQTAAEEPENFQNAKVTTEPAEPHKMLEEEPKPQETPKTGEKTEAEQWAELQIRLDAKRAEQEEQKLQKEEQKEKEKQQQAEELKNYVRKMKEEADRRKQEQIDRFSQYTGEEIKAFFRGDDRDFRDAIADPANKDAYISEIGEENYTRCLEILAKVEKEEKEQKRTESIAAAKLAGK